MDGLLGEGRRMSTSTSSRPIRRPVSSHGRRRTAASQPQCRRPHLRLQVQRVRSHQAHEVRRRGMAPAQASSLAELVDQLSLLRRL